MMQISVLSVGATLTIDGQVTPGAMVAGSILLGRLLFPFDHMVNDWRQWISAGSAWKRVRTLLESERSARQTMPHAQTEGDLVVDRIIYAPSGSERTIMKGVSFSLSPGEILGVIGPSGAGKSTLARLLVGVLKPNSGGVYIDGHNVYLWERGSFGAMVGYVPQSVSLLDGTIAENIARMNEPDARRVVEAARLAGVHELIGRLPLGYDTPVKEGDFKLSGGQKQRVALARALYGQPRLLVLDEPNANLDNEGEQALLRAIAAARDSGAIVVMIAHRPSIMQIADKLLVLQEGRVSQFGPRTSVVGVVTPSGAVPAKAQDHKRLRDATRGQPA
jgi:ATP-binding cassette subfamily C protein